MGAFRDFQEAVRGALNSEPTLTAIVGTKIFDDVPHASEAISTAYPYVTIGDQIGAEAGTSDSDAAEVTVTLHAWTRAPGRLECLAMLDGIRTALHNKSLATPLGVIVYLNYQSHQTLRDPDGETYHGVITFLGLHQYG
jgi:hypothetical protein